MDEKTTETITHLIAENKPNDVAELVNLAKNQLQLPEDEIIKCVLDLHDSGRITLRNPTPPIPTSFSEYLKTARASWFWAIAFLSAFTIVAVFLIPMNDAPLVYLRNALGMIFVLCLPGYSLTRALFPVHVNVEVRNNQKGGLELSVRAGLSVVLSFAFVPLVAMLVGYSPWGLNLTSVSVSLLLLTILFSTVAVVREYNKAKKPV